jgi:predicted dehydrogenase
MKPIKVALIGAGGIGNAHSNAYEQIADAKITVVVDLRRAYAEKLAAVHRASVYTSVEDMLAHEKIDMVDICTPSFTHPAMAILGAQHGWHVLVEKPMAYTREDARAMLEVVKKNGVTFMVAQVIRFWHEYAYLKHIYDNGTYGKLVHIWFSRVCCTPLWAWENWYVDPARSGFAPFELHIHDVDYIHHLLGKPDRVQSLVMNQLEINASFIKTQFFFDTFPEVVVEAEAGWWQGPIPFAATFRAVFERAVLAYDSEKLTVSEAEGSAPKVVDLIRGGQMTGSINLKDTSGIYNEIAYFVECIKTGTAPAIITPEQSYTSLNILLTELESAQTGSVLKI